ncbi:MAG: DNA cytosine methyltransferase [Acidobacteriota bacterium]|nr:DNA cytosine methyltransferase [Acidobacteriota bacterium]
MKSFSARNERPIGIDLFAGAGGLSLGFEQAGFNVAAAVEIDPVHAAVHEFNFPECAVLCADVSKVGGKTIRQAARIEGRQVEVVFGGAPCQGFSLMGKRVLDDPRNKLLLEFLRLTVELDAQYFVFENVKGLTIGRHRQLLDELIEAFGENGYDVVLPYQVLNAANFGVPQSRHRLFLMGAKRGNALPSYPVSDSGAVTVWDAIGDLPDIESEPHLLKSDSVDRAAYGRGSMYARQMHGLEREADDYAYDRAWDERRLTSSMRTEHTGISQRRFLQTGPGEVEPISRFFKLDPNGICNTLRAGTGSDRGAFTSPRPIHPIYPRCISVREAARLHSYPDWFRFHATKWHGFRQIGNSVPPRLGRAVASRIAAAAGISPVKPHTKKNLGQESLLTLNMTEAARHFSVSRHVAGRRTKIPVGAADQLELIAS